MLEHTRASFDKMLTDVKRFVFIFNILTQLFAIALPLFNIITDRGVLALNILLLTVSVGYFIFFLYSKKYEVEKTTKRTAKRVRKYSKIAIKFVNLCILGYGLWANTKAISPFSLILLVFMGITLVLDIILEIAKIIIQNYVQLMKDSFEKDFKNIKEDVKKPVTVVGNIFKKLTGKPTPPPPVLTPEEQKKEEKMNKMLSKWQVKNEAKKEQKRQEKQRAKQEKKAKKQAQPDIIVDEVEFFQS